MSFGRPGATSTSSPSSHRCCLGCTSCLANRPVARAAALSACLMASACQLCALRRGLQALPETPHGRGVMCTLKFVPHGTLATAVCPAVRMMLLSLALKAFLTSCAAGGRAAATEKGRGVVPGTHAATPAPEVPVALCEGLCCPHYGHCIACAGVDQHHTSGVQPSTQRCCVSCLWQGNGRTSGRWSLFKSCYST